MILVLPERRGGPLFAQAAWSHGKRGAPGSRGKYLDSNRGRSGDVLRKDLPMARAVLVAPPMQAGEARGSGLQAGILPRQ